MATIGPRVTTPQTPATLRLARAYAAPQEAFAHDASSPRSPDVVSLSSSVGMPAKARALIAARVDATLDVRSDIQPPTAPTAPTAPSAPRDTAAPASLAFYRHPADRNSVATAIASGSALDVRG